MMSAAYYTNSRPNLSNSKSLSASSNSTEATWMSSLSLCDDIPVMSKDERDNTNVPAHSSPGRPSSSSTPSSSPVDPSKQNGKARRRNAIRVPNAPVLPVSTRRERDDNDFLPETRRHSAPSVRVQVTDGSGRSLLESVVSAGRWMKAARRNSACFGLK